MKIVSIIICAAFTVVAAYSRTLDRRTNLYRANNDFTGTYQFKPRAYLVDVPETEEDVDFLSFVDYYDKGYQSQAEFSFRREIFKRNMRLVKLAQARAPQGSNLKLGATRFADQTPNEM
jgi:hypothetical protein